jgi:Ran GTPase-activating protein (RanGAP) involved in mRNA processing and transport
MSARSKNRN